MPLTTFKGLHFPYGSHFVNQTCQLSVHWSNQIFPSRWTCKMKALSSFFFFFNKKCVNEAKRRIWTNLSERRAYHFNILLDVGERSVNVVCIYAIVFRFRRQISLNTLHREKKAQSELIRELTVFVLKEGRVCSPNESLDRRHIFLFRFRNNDPPRLVPR